MSNKLRVLQTAEAEVGYLEKATNSNLDSKTGNAGHGNFTKYSRDADNIPGFYNGKKQGFPWCDVFADMMFVYTYGVATAKKLLCQPDKSCGAGCGYSANYYKAAGKFHTKNPKPGDQIFFKDSTGAVCHTGLVYKVDNAKVYTIEGNTSGTSGVVANGGGVFKKSYALSYNRIYGYGRPDYYSIVGENPDASGTEKVAPKLTVDGKWGATTTKRLQQIFGTTVDGVVSNQYASYKESNPGLVGGWEWEETPGKNGSQLIKKMQKWAGMPSKQQDGFIGPATIRAFQRKLGTLPDGKVSNPSAMVKALQTWANKQ